MDKVFSKKGLLLLAVMIVFAVVFPLVVSADADHEHDAAACLQVQLCDGLVETVDHTHTDACYDTTTAICGVVEHTHDDVSCNTADPESATLTCLKPVVTAADAHQHTAACYDYTCGFAYDHIHGTDCDYSACTVQDLVCQITDPAHDHINPEECDFVNVHEHTDACCSLHEHDAACAQELACETQEAEEHAHDISCYACSITEHTHDWTLGCYALADADECTGANLHLEHDASCYQWICLDAAATGNTTGLKIGDTIGGAATINIDPAVTTNPYSFTYKWFVSGVEVAGATAAIVSDLTLTYLGANTITCEVTATGGNIDGSETISKSFSVDAAAPGQALDPFFSNVDTSNINVQVFNYGRNINGVGKRINNDGVVVDDATADASVAKQYGMGFFGDYDNDSPDKSGADYHTGNNGYGKTVTRNLGANGYPVSQSSSREFSYLFNPAGNTALSVAAYQTDKAQNGLFQVDANGFYYYDSSLNAAYFDQSSKRFWLYDATLYPGHTGTGSATAAYQNFLPFNDFSDATPKDAITHSNGQSIVPYQLPASGQPGGVDLWFGLNVDFQFLQPKGGMVAPNVPMVFDFDGDDDVWVYIDGLLVIDLSGTHPAENASIDFSTGVVKNNGATTSLKDLFVLAWKEADTTLTDDQINTKIADTFTTVTEGSNTYYLLKDYSEHDFNFFYMERGGNISYCALYFNIITVPKNSLAITKQVQLPTGYSEAEVISNADFHFQLKISQDEQNLDTLVNAAGYAYNVYTVGDTTTPINTEPLYTDENGYFTLKANQTARFEGIPEIYKYQAIEDINLFQYDKITINGTTVSIDDSNPIQAIATDILSAYKDRSVTFVNYCTIDNILDLYLSKTGENIGAEAFKFKVAFDGVSRLMTVTIFDSAIGEDDPNATTATVNTGIIELKAGQTAKIHNIVGDTSYTITEQDALQYTTTAWSNNNDPSETKTISDIMIFNKENQPKNEVVFDNEATAVLTVTKQVMLDETMISNGSNPGDVAFGFKVTIGTGTEQKVYNFTLKDGQTWTSIAFPAGTPYWVEEVNLPLGYSFAGAATEEGFAPSFGNLELDKTTKVKIVNEMTAANISVTKKVTNYVAGATPDEVFTFQIAIADAEPPFAYTIDGVSYATDENGIFTLKHGQTAIFSNIQKGASYEVKELDTSDSFAYAGGNTKGILINNKAITINNTHLSNGLNITKVVEGTITNGFSGNFSFLLKLNGEVAANQPYTILGGNGTIFYTNAEGVFRLAAGQTANFAGLSVGTEYSVEEINIPTGFALQETNPQTGTISDTTAVYAKTFTNKVVTAPLSMTKEVYDTDARRYITGTDNGTFRFVVRINGSLYSGPITIGSSSYEVRNGNVDIRSGETAVIADLQIGTSYSVSEDTSVMPAGYRYASSINASGNIPARGILATIINNYADEPERDRDKDIKPKDDIIIVDPETPLADIPETPTPLADTITIDDGNVPLAETPNTGDHRDLALLLIFAAIAMAAFAGMRIILKAERQKR